MRRLPIALGLVPGVFVCALSYGAGAQDHHHPLHKDFYQHWRDPANPSLSCCNARVEGPDGMEVGDCEPTQAEVRNGQWFAWVRQKREWLAIPDSKVLRERNPNGQDAHLCWTPLRGVICFVGPDTGG
jgi:hypothetical protein